VYTAQHVLPGSKLRVWTFTLKPGRTFKNHEKSKTYIISSSMYTAIEN